MEWLESHDLALYGEVLVFEPFKYPKRSKERSEIWGRIAVNLKVREVKNLQCRKDL